MITRQNIAYISCFIILAGLIVSRVGISIGMIGIMAAGILRLDIGQKFKQFLKEPVWWTITLIFFIYLISGLWSENTDYLLERLRIKLPFLLLPFAVSTLQPFSDKQWKGLLVFFTLLMVGCGIWTLGNYALDFEAINATLKKGHHIPTPVDHIRFSLMVVLGAATGWYLFWSKFSLKYKWEPYVYLFLCLFLVAFMHILVVRSGILTMYLVAIFTLFYTVFQTRKYLLGAILLIGILALPVVAFYTIPSVENKMRYMHYDYVKFTRDKKVNNLSDANRLVSYLNAIELIKKEPWLGVGAGDLKDEMDQLYKANYPEIEERNYLIPHNQYLFVTVTAGVVGLLLFLCCLLYPILHDKRLRTSYLFLSFHLIIFTSFLIESTIEGQVGTALFITFLLFGVKNIKR